MPDFTMITPRLSTGGNIGSMEDVTALRNAGITHVIDCRNGANDAQLFGSIQYLYNGANDDGQPKSVEWYSKSVEFALNAIAKPRTKVHVYCGAGVNRGPSACFAIMLAQGFTPVEAETIMRTKRPQVGLMYKDDAINKITMLGYA